MDVLRERAEMVDKLEAEFLRYKDKMNDIEFFKSRVEEFREDNRILVETKEMLEEELAGSRKRCKVVFSLENEIIKYKGCLLHVKNYGGSLWEPLVFIGPKAILVMFAVKH